MEPHRIYLNNLWNHVLDQFGRDSAELKRVDAVMEYWESKPCPTTYQQDPVKFQAWLRAIIAAQELGVTHDKALKEKLDKIGCPP